MKKTNKIIIFAILAIIILAIILVKIFSGGEKAGKLLKLYNNLIEKKSYILTLQEDNKNKIIMAKVEDNTLVDSITENEHSTTMIKNGDTYVILHDRGEYYVYSDSNIEQNIITDGLKELLDKECVTGKEKIRGHKYNYEEYSGSSIFMITTVRNVAESEIKTRLYFDRVGNLTYIKTIFGEEEEILKVELSYEVSDEIFNIPSNYAENNYASN